LWHDALGVDANDALDIPFVAEKYEFTGGQIQTAARVATALGRGTLTADHIHDAAKGQLRHHLDQLAVRSLNHLTLHDVILPEDLKTTLNSIVAAVRNRRRIFEDWGFAERLTTGKGIAMLFRGESGTGKTLSAEVLGSTLAMPIYRVAIPRIVSKYIGETEQNLEKAFREAQVASAILLFDEADAIFTKRVEVSSATDRYSNMEVNLLLQELERFEGVVILTTNLEAAIDDAFERRLNYKLDFPFPKAEHRREIWRRLLPAKAPVVLNEDDLAYLAERFELSGGSIKNAVLRAAYSAAETDADIGIDLLEGACVQEYRELGKLISSDL
jgi:SpoVK/Ycf46/Vps4 family AAA+-type ATPase